MKVSGSKRCADTVVVLDFETTGMSPDQGDRTIEVGAVRLEQGRITDRFQCLMNPGMRVNGFIENFTGISNHMLRDAPCCEQVMGDFAEFIEDFDLVAHNASFDRRFLDAELRRLGRDYTGEFACSMLVARRLYPDAPNHKLQTLVHYKQIDNDGTFHRALADAEMTARLWLAMLDDVAGQLQCSEVPFPCLQGLAKVPSRSARAYLARYRGQ